MNTGFFSLGDIGDWAKIAGVGLGFFSLLLMAGGLLLSEDETDSRHSEPKAIPV